MNKQHYFFYYGWIVFALLFWTCTLPSEPATKTMPSSVVPMQSKPAIDTKSQPSNSSSSSNPSMNTIDSTITIADLMGKINPAKHPDFILIERKHASRNGMYMRKAAYAAFQRMAIAAQKEGVRLIIKSATRPFASQKVIWEGKWTGKRLVDGGQDLSKTIPDPQQRALKILEYSSMPGTSRHHWGTDIDLNAFTNDYFAKGKGLKEYEWLSANAATYGFCQTYTAKGPDRPYGYEEEKWHWSYLPIAQTLTQQYKLRLNDEAISGFWGAETAPQIEVVRKYVLGINPACL